MGLFREIPPTAGFPIHAMDFLSVLQPGSLEQDFQNFLGLPFAQITCSGTAALYLILETLKDFSSKKTVIIPSFVCPLLALAIVRAGLKIEVCDVQAERFDFDWEQLERICAKNNDILAMITVHLGGLPMDMEMAQRIAKQYNIYLIEDCAQAFGAEYKGRKVGTFGDFSFFSLSPGKGLTICEGGVLATSKKEYAPVVAEKFHRLVKGNFLSESLKILKLFGYGVFYRPSLFWFVFGLPQSFWNLMGDPVRAMGEHFSINFPTHRVSKFRKSLGHAFFYHLEPEIAQQRKKAQYYLEHLEGKGEFQIIKELPQSRATYPYVTLLFRSSEKRKKVMKALVNRGLGASVIYVHAITDYEYLKGLVPDGEYPHGRRLVDYALTLSTNVFLVQKDLAAIISLVTGTV